MHEMLDKVELQGGCLAYFPLQRSKAAAQHCSLHRRNGCHEVSKCIKYFEYFFDNSATYHVQEVLEFNIWTLCRGPLGPWFLLHLWEPNETVVRPVRLHVIGYVSDCFVGVIKFSVVLLSHPQKRIPNTKNHDSNSRTSHYTWRQRRSTQRLWQQLAPVQFCFALRSAGFW